MVVVAYEERKEALLGVKLLALSLEKHCPGLKLILAIPESRASEFKDFIEWSKGLHNLEVMPYQFSYSWMSFNAKPHLLKLLLEKYDEVFWIDTDIIISKDFRSLIKDLPKETFVATEETERDSGQGSLERTKGWNLIPGKELKVTVCSGFIRATRTHLELLTLWEQMLNNPIYIEAQDLPFEEMPKHLLGDQDVLTALLGSKQFEELSLKLLRRGSEIIQEIPGRGYTVKERIENLKRNQLAPLLHAQGDAKPWLIKSDTSSKFQELIRRSSLELSTYFHEARKYRDALGEPATCLEFTSPVAQFFRFVTLNHPTLQGLPLTAIYTMLSLLKKYTMSNSLKSASSLPN
jgi:lipopolysaccharide biosynthesis glycosyltransferase